MHSSRMRTARGSSHPRGEGSASVHAGIHTPPGCGPGDPLGVGVEAPPGVGVETPTPQPGVETQPSQTSFAGGKDQRWS